MPSSGEHGSGTAKQEKAKASRVKVRRAALEDSPGIHACETAAYPLVPPTPLSAARELPLRWVVGIPSRHEDAGGIAPEEYVARVIRDGQSLNSSAGPVVTGDLDLGAFEQVRALGSVRPLRARRRELYRIAPCAPVEIVRPL